MKTSTHAPTLSDRLQQKLRQDQTALAEAVQGQTHELLSGHARTLKALCDTASNSTERVMQSHKKQLEALHQQSFKRLRWLLMVPIAASAILSILIVLITLVWSSFQRQELAHQEAYKRQQIRQLELDFCQTPAGQRICRKGP